MPKYRIQIIRHVHGYETATVEIEAASLDEAARVEHDEGEWVDLVGNYHTNRTVRSEINSDPWYPDPAVDPQLTE